MLNKTLSYLLITLFAGISPLTAIADDIKMKSGETFSGRITYEADDIVKIEVAISASIKETKILARGDIAEIIKDAPDNVAFNKLQKLLPTQSMIPASKYQSMITAGPDAFLATFPESKHLPAVKEIKSKLEAELDKIERGFFKIEDDWISPQDKVDFQTLIESRVRLLRLRGLASSGSYNGLIGAMREYEILEENYSGSPAFASATELALKIIPALGGQLQNVARDVDFRNAEFEKSKAALDEVAMAQIDGARAREDANYSASVVADKKAGIKWIRLNARSKPALEAYLKLASTELNRIKQYDPALLSAQAEKLVVVDKLIAEGNLTAAKVRLTEAAAMTGKKVSSRSSRSSKGGSYTLGLNIKLNQRLAAEAELQKSKSEAAQSEALTANLKKSGEKMPNDDAEPTEGDEETESAQDAFAALADVDKKSDKENQEGESSKGSTKTSAKDKDDRPLPSVEEEGGFSLSMLVPILTVLLIVAVVLLKVLGIGGKKEE